MTLIDNSVFDASKNYRMIVHHPNELRFAKDQNHRQEILDFSLRRHVRSILGTSKQDVASTGHLFTKVYDHVIPPARGWYRFTLQNVTTLLVEYEGGSSPVTITKGTVITNIHNLGFSVVVNPDAQVNDSAEFVVNHAMRYAGGDMTYNGTQVTVNPALVQMNGYDIAIPQQSLNLSLSEGQSRLVVLTGSLAVVDSTVDSDLGHYIQGQGTYRSPSPDALQLTASWSFSTAWAGISQDTESVVRVVYGKVGVTDGTPYVIPYVQSVMDVMRNNGLIYDYLTSTQLTRLQSIASSLTVDLNDGEGARRLLSEKIPSMPNVIQRSGIHWELAPALNTVIQPIFNKTKLRHIEQANVAALNTHILKLNELKAASTIATDKTELTPKITECETVGALTAEQATYLRDTATLPEIPNLIGDDATGYVGNKVSEKSVSNANIESYETDIYTNLQTIDEGVNHSRTGKLRIWWDEPALVENEQIISYRVKLYRMKIGFTETDAQLDTALITTPEHLSSQRGTYITKAEKETETDPKKKKVVNNELIYEDTVLSRQIEVDVKSSEKLVMFIACVTEYGVVGSWSTPTVIDVPSIVVDGDTGTTFAELTDEGIQLVRTRREIEAAQLNRTVQEQLFDMQLAYTDKVDKTELVQKINQLQQA